VAILSLRPSKGREGRERRERGERGGGEKGSTYKRRAATTLAHYDTSTLQGSMASKSGDQNMVGVSRLPPFKNSGHKNFTVNLVQTFLHKYHST